MILGTEKTKEKNGQDAKNVVGVPWYLLRLKKSC